MEWKALTALASSGLELNNGNVDYRPAAKMRLRGTILFVVLVALATGRVFYLNCVNDPVYEGRHLSTWLMAAKIGTRSDQMVPLIVAHLAKTSSSLFGITGPQSYLEAQSVALDILALKEYGGQAKLALPNLMTLKTSPCPKIPLYASEAIAAIAGTNSRAQ